MNSTMELELGCGRGNLTIEDDGETIRAVIRPEIAGAIYPERLVWLRDAVLAAPS
jgi:hypothetical protein